MNHMEPTVQDLPFYRTKKVKKNHNQFVTFVMGGGTHFLVLTPTLIWEKDLLLWLTASLADNWQVTCEIWHMTHNTWNTTCDIFLYQWSYQVKNYRCVKDFIVWNVSRMPKGFWIGLKWVVYTKLNTSKTDLCPSCYRVLVTKTCPVLDLSGS